MLHQYAGRKFIFATKVNEVHHPFARPSRIHDMPPSQHEPVWFSTQVVIFAFNGFQFNQNALGVSKKRPNVPRGWPNLTTSVAFESTAQRTRGTMALTGKVSGITVLDFDNLEVYETLRCEFPWLDAQPRVRSHRGVHIYCNYHPTIRQPKEAQGLQIDVLGDNQSGGAKSAIAPPTQYKRPDGIVVTYTWEQGGALDDIPSELVHRLNPSELFAPARAPQQRLRESGEQPTAAPPSTAPSCTDDEAAALVSILVTYNAEHGYSYDEWFALLCACHAVGQSTGTIDVWRRRVHEISAASTKYESVYTDAKFDEGSKFSSYTMGTVRYYARQADPDAFCAVAAKRVNLDEQVSFEQSDLRDYFLSVMGDNVHVFRDEPGVFYIWREDRAAWTRDGNGDQLKYYIHEECKALMARNKGRFAQQYEQRNAAWLALRQAESPERTALKEAEAEMINAKSRLDAISKTKANFTDAVVKAVFSLSKGKLATEAHEQNLFDERREVFAFANTCYDLDTNTFFKPTKYDYVLTTNGKAWREPTAAERARIAQLLERIFPDPEKLKCWVSLAHASLSGKRHEKFAFFNGGGRNGKGFVGALLLYVLGPGYGYKGHLALLTKEFKDGSNVELRNCHKKRFVLLTEPESSASEQFRINNIKALTGDEEQNARGHYSMDTLTRIFALFVCECNKLPALKGDKDHAIISRMIKLDFESTFTNDEELLARHDPASGVYYFPEDEALKTTEFMAAHFCAFFEYIVTHHRAYGELYIPPCAQKAALAYLQSEDDFANWFQETYECHEPIDINGKKHVYFLPAKALFEAYKESSVMHTASKEERRKFNFTRFKDALSKNVLVRTQYREVKTVSHIRWHEGYGVWLTAARNDRQGLVGWRERHVSDPALTTVAPTEVVEAVDESSPPEATMNAPLKRPLHSPSAESEEEGCAKKAKDASVVQSGDADYWKRQVELDRERQEAEMRRRLFG